MTNRQRILHNLVMHWLVSRSDVLFSLVLSQCGLSSTTWQNRLKSKTNLSVHCRSAPRVHLVHHVGRTRREVLCHCHMV